MSGTGSNISSGLNSSSLLLKNDRSRLLFYGIATTSAFTVPVGYFNLPMDIISKANEVTYHQDTKSLSISGLPSNGAYKTTFGVLRASRLGAIASLKINPTRYGPPDYRALSSQEVWSLVVHDGAVYRSFSANSLKMVNETGADISVPENNTRNQGALWMSVEWMGLTNG